MPARFLTTPLAALLLSAAGPTAWKDCAKSPDGATVCVLTYPYEGQPGAEPDRQRIALYRYGRRVWMKEGDPFVWKWIFLESGKTLAYEGGPMHSEMLCHLVLLSTGKEISTVDCFNSTEAHKWPHWVVELEDNNNPSQEGWTEPLNPTEIPK